MSFSCLLSLPVVFFFVKMSFSARVLDEFCTLAIPLVCVFMCVHNAVQNFAMLCRHRQGSLNTTHFLFLSPIRERNAQFIDFRDWHHRIFFS